VPPAAVVGAWKVDERGKIVGDFIPNPNYRKGVLNLDAEIVPGVGAAGFRLGQDAAEIDAAIAGAKAWTRSAGRSLNQAIDSGKEWVCVSHSELSFDPDAKGKSYYAPGGVVKLQFNGRSQLFNIVVYDGYRGAAWGDVTVGCSVATAMKHYPLEYDDGDEAYYPVESAPVRRIGFHANDGSLEEAIYGISVHDWDMMRQGGS
jgi:hypothetical protein